MTMQAQKNHISAETQTRLAALLRQHALDESLYESLTKSPEQARDHVRFWRRTMWLANGAMISVATLLFAWAMHRTIQFGAIGWLIASLSLGLLAIHLMHVLDRQRKAINEVEQFARRENLI